MNRRKADHIGLLSSVKDDEWVYFLSFLELCWILKN